MFGEEEEGKEGKGEREDGWVAWNAGLREKESAVEVEGMEEREEDAVDMLDREGKDDWVTSSSSTRCMRSWESEPPSCACSIGECSRGRKPLRSPPWRRR